MDSKITPPSPHANRKKSDSSLSTSPAHSPTSHRSAEFGGTLVTRRNFAGNPEAFSDEISKKHRNVSNALPELTGNLKRLIDRRNAEWKQLNAIGEELRLINDQLAENDRSASNESLHEHVIRSKILRQSFKIATMHLAQTEALLSELEEVANESRCRTQRKKDSRSTPFNLDLDRFLRSQIRKQSTATVRAKQHPQKEPFPFAELPFEIQLAIAEYLNPDGQASMALASRSCRNVILHHATALSHIRQRKWDAIVKKNSTSKAIQAILEGFYNGSFEEALATALRAENNSQALVEKAIQGGYFEIADRLLAHQQTAPAPLGLDAIRGSIKPIRDFLKALVCDRHQLHSAMKTIPYCAKIQDEDGNTLFHHAIMHERFAEMPNAILNQFVDSCNTQNHDGDTPLHLLSSRLRSTSPSASSSLTRLIAKLQILSENAIKRGFNFSQLGHEGKTVFQILLETKLLEYHNVLEVNQYLRNILQALPIFLRVDVIDTPSSSGASALHYAIEAGNFESADLLLDFGANPMIGNKHHLLLEEFDSQTPTRLPVLENKLREKLLLKMRAISEKPQDSIFSSFLP